MVDNQQAPHDSSHDPTRVRAQAQLTTASGTTWVVVAAVSTLLLGVMLFVIAGVTIVPVTAGVLMAVLLVSMAMVRALVPPQRLRLAALATLYFTILAVATIATFATILVP